MKNNTATVPIHGLLVNCAGTLNLQSAQQAEAGTTGKVKVKLNVARRKLGEARAKVKVWANVLFSAGALVGSSNPGAVARSIA